MSEPLRYLFRTLVAALVALLPLTAHAQQMNFSYYSDAFLNDDGTVLYTVIDGSDYSTGCTHYDYSVTGYVSGPSGNYQDSFPGLQTFIGVPVAAGNFAFYSDALVNCSCFGSGLGAGGGNGSTTLDSMPSGETTLTNAWSGGDPTHYKWRARLTGGSFAGRQTREREGGGDTDTCHFSTSIYPYATGLTIGSPWNVDSSSEYGDDFVGWNWYVVDYYRNAGRAPCQSETTQLMQINQPQVGGWAQYKSNRLKMGFTSTTVWSERDGQAQSKPW
jgi:hypothetical protein